LPTLDQPVERVERLCSNARRDLHPVNRE
jgi:hypothetical protein